MKNFRKNGGGNNGAGGDGLGFGLGLGNNDINGGDSKQSTDVMSMTGQGFHKRQNSGNFQKGMTLDKYFGGNF